MVHLIWRVCKELGIPMIEVWLNNTLNIYKEERPYWDLFNKWLGIEDKFREFKPLKDKEGKIQTVWTIAKKVGHLPNFRATYKKVKGFKHGNTPECCDKLKKESVNAYLKSIPKAERYDCHFVGTRAAESQIRSLGVLQRCRSYVTKFRKPYHIRTVTPLSFWKKADIYEYFARYNIPVNRTYQIHNITRMGCASCPAYKGWEIDMINDPTAERFGMLKQNLKILRETEPDRFKDSITILKKYLKDKKSLSKLSEANRVRLIKLLHEFDGSLTLHDFVVPAKL